MPSVSLTNAFDITNLDVDVSLTLSGFSDSCDGTYSKTADKTWTLSGDTREIVYVNDTFASPTQGDRSRWEIRDPSTPSNVYFIETKTSAGGHPLDTTFTASGVLGTTVGTIAIGSNRDVGGTIDIRNFSNLTSLNFSYVGLTGVTGNIYSKDLTYVNLAGNSINQRLERFESDSSMEDFIISDSNFYGFLYYIPSTLKHIDISNNNIEGRIPTLAGNTNIEKFIANQTNPYDSPLNSPESITEKDGVLRGRLPSLEGCTKLTHFQVSNNDLNFIDLDYRVPESIIHFDVSNNNLFFGIIYFVLKAFNETFHEASPQIDVSGEGRVINISNNQYDANDSPDVNQDNSPLDDDILTFKTNLESLGWTVII